MNDKSIVILGASGYIGSHLAQALLDQGYSPLLVDREPLSFGAQSRGLEKLTFLNLDISTAPLGSLFDPVAERVDLLWTLGPSSVSHSWIEPTKYYQTHVLSLIRLLAAIELQNALGKYAKIRILFSSSCTVYGPTYQVPITEDSPAFPLSPYARAKEYSERILKDFSRVTGVPVLSFRFFNAAGADPRGHLGEKHDPPIHLIPILMNTALKRDNLFTLYGNQHATPDGSCVRDYIHVLDIAGAFSNALRSNRWEAEAKQQINSENFLAVNLGSGLGFSVLEVLRGVEDVSTQKVRWHVEDDRLGDAPIAVASNTRAKAILDWSPTRSQLPTILTDYWHYFTLNQN